MKTILFVLFVLSALLISCKGDAGPAGPAGPAAITVKFTANQYDWSVDQTYYAAAMVKDIPQITQDIVNNGTVLVYATTSDSWTLWNKTSGTIQYSESIDVGKLYLIMMNTAKTGIPSYFQNTIHFKCIIIHGSKMTDKNINYSDYNSVKKEFNLVD